MEQRFNKEEKYEQTNSEASVFFWIVKRITAKPKD